jgi:outer membrane protein assembly factor BamB
MRKIVGLLAAVILSSVCSLFRSKVVPYPTGIMFPLVKDGELSYEGEIIPQIQSIDSILYFSTRKGKVYCVDAQNRLIQWRFDTTASLVSPAYLGENRIYVYDVEDDLYCIGEQGKSLWKSKASEKITSTVLECRDRVYFGTEKGQVYCLSSVNGEEIWRFQAEGEVISNLVIWRSIVLFGCSDNSIYFIDQSGNCVAKYSTGSSVGQTLLVDGNSLYFGTEDRYLQCLNLAKRNTRWKIRSGGATYVPPVVDGDKVFFLCWNSVLYCLDKKNGTIQWWGGVPSRSYFRVEVIEDKVVASSFSSEIVGFDKKTGEEKGTYDAAQEIVSNPVWVKPFLLVNLYDWESETGKLVILKKEVKVVLSPSKKSPQKRNEEVVFSARETGFYLPKYTFYLTQLEQYWLYPGFSIFIPLKEKQVVQESSDESTWSWFPEQAGYYKVEAQVTDEKEKVWAELPFCIERGEVGVKLTSSVESPQEAGQEVVFKAAVSGLTNPKFEFRLGRLIWLKVISDFVILYPGEENIVQELSESDSWTWIPEEKGFYRIRVLAQDEQERAEADMSYTIEVKKKE